MKKFAAGCLLIVVLAVALLAGGAYYAYRAARPMLDDARAYLSRMTELGEIAKQIENTAPHTPPANGELTEEQVQRFVRVQDSVRAALGQRFGEIEAKYRHLKDSADGSVPPSITEMLGAVGDIANIFVEARRYQVTALNQERFSQAEYSWVRDRVFQAAGVEITRSVDFKKLEEAVRNGTGIEDIRAPDIPMPRVPEKNRVLVKPHLTKMDDWLPLAFFGL
jgi:hypothetical protein